MNIENDRPQTVPAYSSIKDDHWRQQVVTDIKLNAKVIDRSDKVVYHQKHVDPLTNLRDVLRQLSNQEAFKYMRQCRLIVAKLKQSWVDVNEEIKSLMKTKEFLESAIEHIRKDILINQETIDNRVYRPARETEHDGVDEILAAERHHLYILKRNIEIALRPIQILASKMDETREEIFRLGRERSRVTDLICQCLTQSIRTYDASVNDRRKKASTGREHVSKSLSHFGNQHTFNDATATTTNSISVGPLSAFTPETIMVMDIANNQINEGKELRRNAKKIVDECMDHAKVSSKTVEDYFVKKISESVTLTQNLVVGQSENKLAQNRANRWQELNELALKYSLGPEKYTNLQTYEKLDRPIMKTFQRHPGNQVPEAQKISEASEQLAESVNATTQQVKSLKIVGQRLNANQRDKEAGLSVDCALLRRRRALSNHKWTPLKYVKDNINNSSKLLPIEQSVNNV